MSTNKLSRRMFLKAAGLTAGAAMLAACAPAPGGAPAAEGGEPAAEPIELIFWGFATNRNNWYAALAEKYTEANPNVTVDVQELTYQEMHDRTDHLTAPGSCVSTSHSRNSDPTNRRH